MEAERYGDHDEVEYDRISLADVARVTCPECEQILAYVDLDVHMGSQFCPDCIVKAEVTAVW